MLMYSAEVNAAAVTAIHIWEAIHAAVCSPPYMANDFNYLMKTSCNYTLT